MGVDHDAARSGAGSAGDASAIRGANKHHFAPIAIRQATIGTISQLFCGKAGPAGDASAIRQATIGTISQLWPSARPPPLGGRT